MEKIKALNRWQKGILLLMLAMVLVFTAVYIAKISRVGFEYKDTILVPSQENGSTVYAGKLWGQPAQFTVSEDKTVVFQYGDKTYGPYTAKEDPTAIPKGEEMAEFMTGVELRQGETILFRGGILAFQDSILLYNEDGTIENLYITVITGDGIERGADGSVIDSAEPTASAILELINDPVLTHKGNGTAWFGAVAFCLVNAISILFADELFRWNLRFRIRDVEQAEPSDWEMAARYCTWAILTVVALVLFMMGLR